jgi:hypothetical protein
MPAISAELKEHLNMGDVVLGGCCITDCDPVYHCNKCKKGSGAPTVESGNEATSFYFSKSLTIEPTVNSFSEAEHRGFRWRLYST